MRKWPKGQQRKYRERERRESDPIFYLKARMRSSIHATLKYGVGKNGMAWESLTGYTAEELKKYLEKRWLPGMSWENYGEWHIDHIVPISVFNFRNAEDVDFKRCWALKNLRPLWAKDNLSKGSRILKPFQPSLAI